MHAYMHWLVTDKLLFGPAYLLTYLMKGFELQRQRPVCFTARAWTVTARRRWQLLFAGVQFPVGS